MKKNGALEVAIGMRPDVFNHNLETVPRLYPAIRPGARYFHSLRLLQRVKELDPTIFVGNDEKVFVIHVEHNMGAIIGMFLRDTPKERPLTHDLVATIFKGFGITVERAIITDLKNSTYFARLILQQTNELGRKIVEVDARSGATRNIVDEKAETFIWTAHAPKFDEIPGVWTHYLDDTGEIIYASERDGWKHLYLIDARTGAVKNQITRGAWAIRGVDQVDAKARQIWFRGNGRNHGQDPYFVHYYRVNFDGSGLVALTEGDGDHYRPKAGLAFSPDKKHFIDTYSRVDMPPVHELRRVSDGSLVCKLEQADVSALEATGWRAPEVFVAKGRDGKTDIWGIVCRPQKHDPKKKYPVIEYIYAGPHGSFTPKSFAAYRNMMALAELGFIVVQRGVSLSSGASEGVSRGRGRSDRGVAVGRDRDRSAGGNCRRSSPGLCLARAASLEGDRCAPRLSSDDDEGHRRRRPRPADRPDRVLGRQPLR